MLPFDPSAIDASASTASISFATDRLNVGESRRLSEIRSEARLQPVAGAVRCGGHLPVAGSRAMGTAAAPLSITFEVAAGHAGVGFNAIGGE